MCNSLLVRPGGFEPLAFRVGGHKNGEVEKADFDQNYILDLASGGKVKGAV